MNDKTDEKGESTVAQIYVMPAHDEMHPKAPFFSPPEFVNGTAVHRVDAIRI